MSRNRQSFMFLERSPRRRRGVCNGTKRSGIIVIGVLACLLVVTTIGAVTIRFALRDRAEQKIARKRFQVQSLCDAGLMRGMEKLSLDASYSGEQWEPSLGLQAKERALIEIKVQRDEAKSESVMTVVARLVNEEDKDRGIQKTITESIKTTTTQSKTENGK